MGETELIGQIQTYEESYKLCYIRGPEGIILELAEQLKTASHGERDTNLRSAIE